MAPHPPVQQSHLPTPSFTPLMRQHNRSPGLSTGSATQTLSNTPQRSESPEPLILRLRGAHTPQSDSASDSAEGSSTRRHIQWAEDVIDNEGLGRKKSKVCCIYHKPRPVGESSDESSSDSDSSSDESDFGGGRDGARPVGGRRGNDRGRKGHDHEHGDGCGHSHGHGDAKKTKKTRRPSPNAYEKVPRYDVKPLTRQPGAKS